MKKISVIVPVYKVEAVLKKCLDSIITQTYMVVIRDGSRHMCMDCTGQEGSGCS